MIRLVTPERPSLGVILKWLGICIIAGTLIFYAVYQARLLIAGPSLALDQALAVTYTERVATITGTARNVSAITLNDRTIFTDDDGRFNERLVLENGYTIMTLRATDRYGRVVTLTQPLVYTPAYD